MANVEYLGHSCFLIRAEEGRFLTDPFGEIGYDLPSVKAEYVTISHGHYDHCNTLPVRGVEEVFTDPYSYLSGRVEGCRSYHDGEKGALRGENVIFKIRVEGITITHMGDIGERFSEEMRSFLQGTDVLLLPVGGVYTVDAAEAMEYVREIQPKMVIPMHYNDPASNIRLNDLETFLSLCDPESVETAEGRLELELSDKMRVVALQRRQ